ncbi:MAG: hypothetical protein DWQ07_07825 [Chloroflexi bacterium]|nr:MAG: hypothetical protein DWQ07_07825 [Chloroflexota bacterium]MBL1197053.1 hypothetical protein [Chloroflexota bacterium]NOH14348.1 hypothetical protein [Chloroflexota bacterium]
MRNTNASFLKRHPRLALALLALSLLASACVSGGTPAHLLTNDLSYTVAPVFEDTYDQLGGMTHLGPAISESIPSSNQVKQYLQAGLLVYDPNLPPPQQVYFEPLGAQLGYGDPAVPAPADSSQLYVNGHVIHADFVELYNQLGGRRYVGNPLTEAHENADKGRLEQHFENMGFYKDLDPSNPQPQLLFYGAFVCDFECRSPEGPGKALIEGPAVQAGQFAEAVEKIGSTFTGPLIAGPYAHDDGSIEAIFENLVLYFPASEPRQAYARSIVQMIGFEASAPVPRVDSPDVYFFTVEGELGYNVPASFYDYIILHGGLDVSGNPITELFLLEEGVYRQCFANTCLDYHTAAQEGLRVRPAQLGPIYKAQHYIVDGSEQPPPPVQEHLDLFLDESYPLVSSQQNQTLLVNSFNGVQAIEALQLNLTVTLPDGTQHIYLLPLTDAGGHTQITIPPIIAANGTLILYEVCTEDVDLHKVCATDSYVIWGN